MAPLKGLLGLRPASNERYVGEMGPSIAYQGRGPAHYSIEMPARPHSSGLLRSPSLLRVRGTLL